MSQPSAFTFLASRPHVVFCIRSSELIWRDATITGRSGGLGIRLQFECILAVHTDQRLHGFAMSLAQQDPVYCQMKNTHQYLWYCSSIAAEEETN